MASLNRSRFGTASTGAFLENISKLLQILAVVVGAIWILKDYWEFKRENNELVNTQLKLANDTAQLTQSSLFLNNQLSNLKLERSTQGYVSGTTESSVVRSTKFDDGTFLYRFQVGLTVKNISESTLTVHAAVIEIFLGTLQANDLQAGKVNILNLPYSRLQGGEDGPPGGIKWTQVETYIQRPLQIDDRVTQLIRPDFVPIPGGLPGGMGPSESHDWNGEFILRAHPTDFVASIITFWITDEKNELRDFNYTRSESLSEAQDSSALKTNQQAP
jgi:hypothetical protein